MSIKNNNFFVFFNFFLKKIIFLQIFGKIFKFYYIFIYIYLLYKYTKLHKTISKHPEDIYG